MILSRGRKLFIGLGILAVVVVLAVTLTGWLLMRKPLPQLEGEFALDGLSKPVTVYRDEHGVPHIVAHDERDLMIATGYVQAQDRLWQMDLLRRVAEGRLSEILGKRALDADKMLRTVGMMRVAKQIADSLDQESKNLLEAYTEGVNQFIEKNLHNYPIEFVLLGYEPYPWKIEHSIGISRVIAWQLNMGWFVDLNYQRIRDSVGSEMTDDILPGYPADAPVIVDKAPSRTSNTASHYHSSTLKLRLTHHQQEPLFRFMEANWFVRDILGSAGSAFGSNCWVVSGDRSVTGKPLLANDPHLAHGVPSTWYEVHLRGGRFDVAGFALPGTPLVVLGNNDSIAWGFTNVMCDDADFFQERVEAGQYFFKGQWRPLRVITERIAVKDSEDVEFEIRSTHHGPLISGLVREMKEAPISLQWQGLQPSFELRAIKNLNLAGNWNSFRSACSDFKVPGQNVMYADIMGNIGYQCMSGVPVRRGGDGLFVHDGSSGDYDWTTSVSFEELPFELNPERGFLASANNKTAGDWFPYFIGNYWEHPSRIRRIYELLGSQQQFSPDDFEKFQLDFYSWHAREVMSFVLPALSLDSTLQTASDRMALDPYQEAYLILRHWNYEMDELNRGAAIFNHFFRRLLYRVYLDKMGEATFLSFIKLSNIPTRVTSQLLSKPDSKWWDDSRTPAVENRDDVLRLCFRETVDAMTKRYGRGPSGWMWGDMHHVAFEHIIGKQTPFDYVFNVGPMSIGGNTSTINNTEYFYGDSTFRVLLGASMRRIVDLSDIGHPKSVLTLGQSGQPQSAYYDDQVWMWLRGEYKTVSMKADEFSNDAKMLILIPARGE